jgi:hypothetical protein
MHRSFDALLPHAHAHSRRVVPGLDGRWNVDCTHYCQDSLAPRIWIDDLVAVLTDAGVAFQNGTRR